MDRTPPNICPQFIYCEVKCDIRSTEIIENRVRKETLSVFINNSRL